MFFYKLLLFFLLIALIGISPTIGIIAAMVAIGIRMATDRDI